MLAVSNTEESNLKKLTPSPGIGEDDKCVRRQGARVRGLFLRPDADAPPLPRTDSNGGDRCATALITCLVQNPGKQDRLTELIWPLISLESLGVLIDPGWWFSYGPRIAILNQDRTVRICIGREKTD